MDAGDGEPRIEFLWWRECPSSERALELLHEEVAAAGFDPRRVEAVEVTSEAEAQRHSFPGSPTIRIDGVDVDRDGASDFGLTCRAYRRADGRVSPLPDREQVKTALRAGRGADRSG